MIRSVIAAAAGALAIVGSMPAVASPPRLTVSERFRDPAMPVLVVAHRACHEPAPHSGMPTTNPENSVTGIARCIALGVDMAEVDVRRTRDGYLVLMHDETVDRTTDGHGEVSDLTLAQIKGLRLRQNEGAAGSVLTDQHVPTLAEALDTASGKVLLNLDVQAGLYADVVAAVRAAGRADQVIVKQPASTGSPLLADTAPFDTIAFMPILVSAGDGGDLPSIAERQVSGHRKPVAIELPRMPASALSGISDVARKAGVRLWTNTLWEGFVDGFGGDIDALRDPDAVWGRLRAAGISVFQTDEPEALQRYLGKCDHGECAAR